MPNAPKTVQVYKIIDGQVRTALAYNIPERRYDPARHKLVDEVDAPAEAPEPVVEPAPAAEVVEEGIARLEIAVDDDEDEGDEEEDGGDVPLLPIHELATWTVEKLKTLPELEYIDVTDEMSKRDILDALKERRISE